MTEPSAVDDTADWVLVAVKSHQTDAAVPWLDRLCGPNTTVVVLQNGIEGEQRLTPLSGEAEVLPAVVYCATELLVPGHVVHRQSQMLIVPERAASGTASPCCSTAPRSRSVSPTPISRRRGASSAST